MKTLWKCYARSSSGLLFVFMFFVLSCQKDKVEDPSPVVTKQTDDALLKRLLKRGFKRENIEDRGDYYLVEGDIRFDKTDETTGSSEYSGARQRVKNDGLLANILYVGNITVQVKSSNFANTAWRQRIVTATQAAISNWNNLPYCGVNFVYTPEPASASVYVELDATLPNYYYGSTDLSACQVGHHLRLNNNSINLSTDQLTFLISHELGHTLGFTHTDHQGDDGIASYVVYNTLDGDSQSIMNSAIYFNSNAMPGSVPTWSQFSSGFSTLDRVAANFLFPNNESIVSAYSEDYSGYPITVTWTPSHFCKNQVKVIVLDDTGQKVNESIGLVANEGHLKMTKTGLHSGDSYEYRVVNPDNTNDYIYTNVSFTFVQ